MKKKRIAKLALALLFLSSSVSVSAGLPNFDYSKDFDVGTLESTRYETSFGVENNLLLHSYTFDLAGASTVDAWLFNPRMETGDIYTGIPPLTITLFEVAIFDSGDQELYKGIVADHYTFGSTMRAHVGGVLPAGDNYYVRIAGSQINDTALAYQFQMWATPVPEPETYAMMLAGLGLMGYTALRRRKQSA
ncbi:MAG: PEP-CTERM sorting domain-containing protein [Nitrosospira sp.]|nr:PEP-CTERM sorting domain-containing protein [Nitrosospira sp.]